ncbi:hypothetical protein [Streptomyces sp. NPDC059175]|uniref:hypothetical protein n=1 Tax=unclassified Streptomyces TaxID=2593676 RepID=UPI0036D00DB6
MHATGRRTCLASAISTEYEIVNASAHLLPVLPVIRAHEFVLVRAADGQVSGIVTSADLAGEFGTVARPFFTLGEIERRLRRCLGRVYDEDDVQKVHNLCHWAVEQGGVLDRPFRRRVVLSRG